MGCLLSFVVAAPASGAAWLPPADIIAINDTEAAAPAVAVNAVGAAAVVWIATQPGGNHAIRLATRPAGGTFSLVGTFQSSSSANFLLPRVAIDDRGDVLASWTRDGTTQVMTRSATGTNSVPAAVTSTPYGVSELAVGIDGTGRGTLLQSEVQNPLDNSCSTPPIRQDLRLRAFPVAADGTLGSPATLASTSGCLVDGPYLTTVRLGLNAGGDAVASANVNGTTRFYSRSLYAGPLTTVGSSATSFGGAVDIADSGRYVLTYAKDKAYLAFGTAGGAPATAIPLGDAGSVLDTGVGVDDTGAAVAAWRTFSGANRTPFLRAVTTDGALAPGPTVEPTHADDTGPLAFDAGGSGSAFLLWRAPTGPANTDAILAAVRTPDGVVSTPVAISGDLTQSSSSPVVGADDHGEALAAFVRPVNGSTRVMVAQFDSIAPALSDITGPSTLTTGQAGSYAVTATDDWSGATVHWDFGDGTTADGPSVTHTFSAAGTPTVTATATDAAGNPSVKTLPVTVTAAGGGGGGGGGGSGPGPAPALTQISVAPARFAVARAATAVSAVAKPVARGTHIRFTLAAPATVVFAFQHALGGRRAANGHCVRPTKQLGKAKHCTRWRREGTLTRKNRVAGANAIAFSGKIGSRALRRGRHRVTLRATATDGQNATARPVGFRIVRG